MKVTLLAEKIDAISYGSIIPAVLNFKENIFGYWDDYTPFYQDSSEVDDETIVIDNDLILTSDEPPKESVANKIELKEGAPALFRIVKNILRVKRSFIPRSSSLEWKNEKNIPRHDIAK